MRHPVLSFRALPLVAAAACLLATAPAHAQNVFDDFDDGNDNGWTRYQPLSAFGFGGTYSFPSGAYRMQAAASPNPAALGVQRVGSLLTGVAVTDFSASVDITGWNDASTTGIGIFARLQQVGLGTTDGYYLHVNLGGAGTPEIVLDRLTNEAASLPSPAAAPLPAIGQGTALRLTLEGIGSQLVGRVFRLSDLGTPLATISYNDANPYASGAIGIGTTGLIASSTGIPINSPLDATFDNFRLVPAPGAAALLGLAGLVASRRRRA